MIAAGEDSRERMIASKIPALQTRLRGLVALVTLASPSCAARVTVPADPAALPVALALGSATERERALAPAPSATDAGRLGSAPDRQPPGPALRACPPRPSALAWLDPAALLIRTREPIEVHPLQRLPSPRVRALLDAVAALMARERSLQLVRVEVRGEGGAPPTRATLARTQAHADAIFRYLWRTRHVLPERLEAVGLGGGGALVVSLRVVQREGFAPRPSSASLEPCEEDGPGR